MKKYLSIILCCITLSSILSGCHRNSAATNPPTSLSLESSAPSVTQSNTDNLPTTFRTQHISQTLECGISIDADVTLADNLDCAELATYTGTLEHLTADAFREMVIGEKSVVNEEQQTVPGYRLNSENYQWWEYSDGSGLMCSEESLYYTTDLSNRVLSCFNDGDKGSENYTADKYTSTKDFNFASSDQCLSEIKALLTKLNIQTAGDVQCYHLDYKTMNSVAKELNLDVLLSSDVDSSFAEFTAEDNCYYFVFHLSVGGFPATEQITGSSANGSLTPGSTIRVLYSKDGICYFEASGIYNTAVQTSSNNGYDLTGALGLLNDRFSSILYNGTYCVTDMAFEYIPQTQNGLETITFIPAWRFTLQNTVELSSKEDAAQTTSIDTFETIFFNAMTGQEILRDIE